MGKYIFKRILMFIPVLLAVAILVFWAMSYVPGDPAESIAGQFATEAELEQIRINLGLRDPFLVRLGRYLKNVFLHFDFGSSYISKVSISDEIMRRLPRTMALGMTTWVITLLVGIPLGVVAGVNHNKFGDRLAMILALVGVSLPQFWIGLLLVLLFSLYLGILPASGMGGIQYMILPVITGALSGIAQIARQTRSAMVEVIRSDFITTARAKGLSRRNVIWRHALPNALIPIIAVSGNNLAHVVAGSVVIETIFSYPGIGLYLINGFNQRDYPVVQGCIIMLAIVCTVVMLLIDIVYAFVDPKILAKYTTSK